MWVSLAACPQGAAQRYLHVRIARLPAISGGGAGVSFFVLTYVSAFCLLSGEKAPLPAYAPNGQCVRSISLKELLKVGADGICTFFEVSFSRSWHFCFCVWGPL